MSALERIVRPFQRSGVSYPTRIFDPTQKEAEDTVLMIGKEGSTKTFNKVLFARA